MASLMLGMDIYETEVYVALWSEDDRSAHSFNVPGKSKGDSVPFCVVPADFGGFLAGSDAEKYALNEKRGIARRFFGDGAIETFTCNGRNYTGEELLTGFFEDVLSAIKKYFGGALISKLCITGESLKEDDKKKLRDTFVKLGYGDCLFIEDHANAFLMYMVCADEMRERQTAAAVELNSHGACLYSYHPSNRTDNTPYYVESIDTAEIFPIPLSVMMDENEKIEAFDELINFAVKNTDYPTIFYVTGLNMEDDSLKNVLRRYASKRMKVFLGQNMYSSGACYIASNDGIPEDIIKNGSVFHTVSIEGYMDAVIDAVPIIKAGEPLSNAYKKIHVIPDNTNEISFRIKDARNGKTESYSFRYDAIKERENKTTRLEISVRFLDNKTLVLKTRDLGFGDICKATYKISEKIIGLT